ncbi:hypothetical protein LX32DRAFT_698726 [Colletotrichum zoysiae]|uniref:Uncharacterized protein n=1 Tax=Colletotrichum zoysiae TaxID=1216348 RepID=A0AAD9H536_9PEZI|nr:hypothetical protein LX32DRAFT_698726 [Colletotrichum zoysiae]
MTYDTVKTTDLEPRAHHKRQLQSLVTCRRSAMCEWYRRNYACGHHFTGASEWCYRYSQTQKRCKVVVTQVDYDSSVCKSCMKKSAKTQVPWEHMIDRSKSDPNRDE